MSRDLPHQMQQTRENNQEALQVQQTDLISDIPQKSDEPSRNLIFIAWRWLQQHYYRTIKSQALAEPAVPARPERSAHIEDYQPGYPQFSALIASHPSFRVYRRFQRVRARLLLIKQDELSVLESRLDQIDNEEERELFLGNRRRDRNVERKGVLDELEHGIAVYDAMLNRNREICSFERPREADLQNLRIWIDNKASVARDETAYLSQPKDLMTFLSPRDDAMARLTPVTERLVGAVFRVLRKPRCDVSSDPNVTLLSESMLQNLTRALIALAVVVFLLVPIIIINTLTSVAFRMMVIVVASAFLITALSSLTNAKTVEVFVSGATYATVLVVFISGDGGKAG